MENKSITQIIEEVKEEVWDKYCKYPVITEDENIIETVCPDCPLNKLWGVKMAIKYDEYGLSEARHKKALKAEAGHKPKFHKGRCGKKYDYYTCGQCGAGIEIIDDYCYKCGYRVLWDNLRCLTGSKAEEEEWQTKNVLIIYVAD